jgi:hypothetical protein
MANTEGLTDEEMISSMQATVTDWEKGTSSSPSIPLAERIDRMGLGGQPSAKVVRKSKKIAVPKGGNVYNTNTVEASTGRTEHERSVSVTQVQPEATMILGEVVERKRTKGQRQRRQKAPTSTHEVTRRQGFPSLQRPLGTFTPKRADVATSAGDVLTHAMTASSTLPPRNNSARPKDNATSSDEIKSLESIQKASAREADQLLNEMSKDEIRQSTQELKGMLSSDTLAFLKRRGQTKMSRAAQQNTDYIPVASTLSKPTTDQVDNEQKEKERVAGLLASVRTYDDMDAIYQAETGQASEWAPDQKDVTDPFAIACDLLRSTLPRQTLWAVRTVRDHLARNYRDSPHSLRLPDASQTWPYPILLPVSLRCLLDESPYRVNGFSLHTYALESIYLLLRLRCAEEHDVNLTSTRAGLNDDAVAVYQLVLGQDAVPVRPTSCLYKSTSVQPLSLGEHEHVAYATASSSTSAIQDGNKFVNDPLWTLLSQMRMIPRLATLIQYNLPEEAILALVGILAMIAQRSPGAATAMVQHKTLLHDVARTAWGVHEQSSAVNNLESLQLSVVRFWTILARQSRIAASDLELPPWGMFLGVTKKTAEGQALQRWTLILWRTLLRYGFQTQELEAMLTFASPRLAFFHANDSGLTTEYLSCFSLVLRIYHDRAVKAPDNETFDHQNRHLVKVRAWLASWYQKSHVHLVEVNPRHLVGDTDAVILAAACLDFCRVYISAGIVAVSDALGEFKSEAPTAEDDIRQLEILQRFVSDGTVSRSVETVARSFFPSNELKILTIDEGAFARFLEAFCAVTWMLHTRAHDNKQMGFSLQNYEELTTPVSVLLTKMLTEFFSEAVLHSNSSSSSSSSSSHVNLGWQNRGRFTVLELVRLTCRKEDIASVIRISLGVVALSRLQVGDESLADRILRLDIIDLPLNLRSVLLAQLHSGAQKKLQMEHSISLNSNYLLYDNSLSELQSLRSEADVSGRENDSSILPLGNYWLWKILAGSSSPETPITQIIQTLTSTLYVLYELESTGESESPCMNGSKTYFLLNVCLQSEDVLGDESVGALCTRVLTKLLQKVDSHFVKAFADSCVGHSSVPILDESSKDVLEEERKLAEALLEEEQDPTNVLSGKHLRIVMDFVNDLCTNFCDYGAQYPFFGICFRVFLYPAFPSKIRCEVLARLQGLLHLVFLPDEDPVILNYFWKIPQLDGDTLDALALSYSRSSPNRFEGLVYHYAIGALGTSLYRSVQQGKIVNQRRRLQGLHPTVLAQVAHWAHLELNGTGTRIPPASLVEQANEQKDDMTWDQVLELFSE